MGTRDLNFLFGMKTEDFTLQAKCLLQTSVYLIGTVFSVILNVKVGPKKHIGTSWTILKSND